LFLRWERFNYHHISFCESSLLPTMDEQISFKNFHSREYSGHKKKARFSSLLHFSIFPPCCGLIILLGLFEREKNPLFNVFFQFSSGFFFICICFFFQKVHSVAWNCIDTKLASGSVDQTARIWHIEK
jgi:WD40 repeat protein